MPVSIVIGGQYGSEGKGKVAQYVAEKVQASAVVRVGGSNSGHTTLASDDQKQVFRHLPTAAILPDVVCVIPAGSYVRASVLLEEVHRIGLGPDRLVIDPRATLVTDEDVAAEETGKLGARIGSTCSGTGEAVVKRVRRRVVDDLVVASRELRPYLRDAVSVLREIVDGGGRVVVEGTQGFGLSLLHSPHFPMVTSRDTSAAGALAETGLSPMDIDDIVMVTRALPIRVAGNSGPFDAEELDWEQVRTEGGHRRSVVEHTTVTGRVRRVARFDPAIVRRAIAVNQPTRLVLNHVDLIDAAARDHPTTKTANYIEWVESQIERRIDLVGLGPDHLMKTGAQRAAGLH